MKRLLGAVTALFLCLPGCSGGSDTPAPTPGPTPSGSVVAVQVYTNATLVSASDVQQWCSDLALQFARDVSPAWGVNATFQIVSTPPTSWPGLIVEDSSGTGDQGYQTNSTAYVDVGQSLAQNGTPEATAGKEVLELVFQRTVCGPVAPYAYPVAGFGQPGAQVLHDFLFPSWWTGASQPFDQMRILTQPGEIAPGGLAD